VFGVGEGMGLAGCWAAVRRCRRLGLGAVALAEAEGQEVMLESGRAGSPQGLAPSRSSPRENCTIGQGWSITGKGWDCPAQRRHSHGIDRQETRDGHGTFRMGTAWTSHGRRMGFARAYAVFQARSHPSSSGTMALVVWMTLPM
jgi:hypothetical protein